MTPYERFVAKVSFGTGCWEWQAGRFPEGYGAFRMGGQGSKTERAQRAAWIFWRGEIPEGLWVLHHCDNPPCVNPAHLFLGTHADNVRDREAKGRGRKAIDLMAAKRRARTHCLRGHEFDAENTLLAYGRRHCRACQRARYRASTSL